jgi:hypothetical protein
MMPSRLLHVYSFRKITILHELKFAMRWKAILFLMIFTLSSSFIEAEEVKPTKSMILHPEWYLKVVDFSYFTAARVAIFSNFKIENTADIAYKDIKVKAYYYSTFPGSVGQIISSTSGYLPITVPPNSNNTYLKNGITMGAGSINYRVKYVEVLHATPVVD